MKENWPSSCWPRPRPRASAWSPRWAAVEPDQQVLETALEVELIEQLGHDHGRTPAGSNVRNGTRSGTDGSGRFAVMSAVGFVRLCVFTHVW